MENKKFNSDSSSPFDGLSLESNTDDIKKNMQDSKGIDFSVPIQPNMEDFSKGNGFGLDSELEKKTSSGINADLVASLDSLLDDPESSLDKDAANREIIQKEALNNPIDNFETSHDNSDISSMLNVDATQKSSLDDIELKDGVANHFDSGISNDFTTDSLNASSPALSDNMVPAYQKKKNSVAPAKLLKICAAVLLVLAVLLILSFFFLNNDAKKSVSVEPGTTEVTDAKPVEAPDVQKINPSESTETVTSDNNPSSDTPVTTPTSAQTEVSSEAEKPSNEATTSEEKPTDTAASKNQLNQIDTKAIVEAAIPLEETLVKEEIDRLQDQNEQFVEQTGLLGQRVEMMDELTKRKAEQIKLLEEQISQLEKSKSDK